MDWAILAAVGEILSAAGVMASLLYLARQFRINTAQDRRAAGQAVLTKLHEFLEPITTEREVTSIWMRGAMDLDGLDPEDAVRFSTLALRYFRLQEELFHYRRASWVDDWAWEAMHVQFVPTAERKGVLTWWVRRRDWFSRDFRQYVETSLSADALSLLRGIEEQTGRRRFASGDISGALPGSPSVPQVELGSGE